MESARKRGITKKSNHELSVWEIEEKLDYESLTDEFLDQLYSAKEEHRRKLLTKLSRARYRGKKHASKKSRRLGRASDQVPDSDPRERLDIEELDFDDWDG